MLVTWVKCQVIFENGNGDKNVKLLFALQNKADLQYLSYYKTAERAISYKKIISDLRNVPGKILLCMSVSLLTA